MLNVGLNQEMQDKEADPSHREYRVQPGVVDLEHLELVALKRVSKSSWMPHFRLIAPSQSPRCLSHTQEHVEPSQQGPEVDRDKTMEG
jgi:hypothetical protein